MWRDQFLDGVIKNPGFNFIGYTNEPSFAFIDQGTLCEHEGACIINGFETENADSHIITWKPGFQPIVKQLDKNILVNPLWVHSPGEAIVQSLDWVGGPYEHIVFPVISLTIMSMQLDGLGISTDMVLLIHRGNMNLRKTVTFLNLTYFTRFRLIGLKRS